MSAVHVCRPASVLSRIVRRCPTCMVRRRMVVRHFAWYDATVTCTACGDAWSDGQRLPRPFRPGWRTEAAKKAKAEWLAALPLAEAKQALRELLEAS